MSLYCFEIPISVSSQEHNLIPRLKEPVSIGLPLPKGSCHDSSKFVLLKGKSRVSPIQIQVLSKWSDKSFKWILLDFFADVYPGEVTELALAYSETLPIINVQSPMCFQKSSDSLTLSTGEAVFVISNNIFKPFDRISVKGIDVLENLKSRVVLIDEVGTEYEPKISKTSVEAEGPVRSTLCIQGELLSTHRLSLANFVSRLSFFANSGFVEMKLTLHNPRAAYHPGGLWDLGDPGSVFFRDLTASFILQASSEVSIKWMSEPTQSFEQSSVSPLEIYQDSSGGRQWRSTNHVNRFERITQSFPGYRVRAGKCVLYEGKRATPILALHDDKKGIAATIDKFWQNFPKALEVDGNSLNIRLFPRQYRDIYELQGGEQKTHTVFLQFDAGQESPGEIGWVHDRLFARTTPEWYAKTNAYSYLTPLSMDKHAECQALIDSAIEGSYTFFDRREVIDEYGWRHFGDLYADHEAVGHEGDEPFVSHYNNQYDAIYGAIIQYAKSGDPRWFCLMRDLARHVIDIDIYHTKEDRPAYNGGMFWHTDHYVEAATATHRSYSRKTLKTKHQSYGGGLSNEHNYTSGLLYYYYLTGDRSAYETVQSLAEWVLHMDDGSHRPLGWLDRRPTGQCSCTASWDFHGPGRGGGNSINALLDAYILTGESRYLDKAEELIRRCIHPNDNIERHDLRDVERRWSYTVFLQVLGKYLDLKVERDEIDYMYGYARDSLLHYAAWMLENEVPYKLVLDRVAIPTETWPAQDIRKSNVFKFAAKYANEPLRSAFLQKAESFFEACITDLCSFETCTLTRPLVLLMTNSFMQSYFDQHPEETAPLPHDSYDFGEPLAFTPQFSGLHRAREKVNAFKWAVQSVMQRLTAKRRG